MFRPTKCSFKLAYDEILKVKRQKLFKKSSFNHFDSQRLNSNLVMV